MSLSTLLILSNILSISKTVYPDGVQMYQRDCDAGDINTWTIAGGYYGPPSTSSNCPKSAAACMGLAGGEPDGSATQTFSTYGYTQIWIIFDINVVFDDTADRCRLTFASDGSTFSTTVTPFDYTVTDRTLYIDLGASFWSNPDFAVKFAMDGNAVTDICYFSNFQVWGQLPTSSPTPAPTPPPTPSPTPSPTSPPIPAPTPSPTPRPTSLPTQKPTKNPTTSPTTPSPTTAPTTGTPTKNPSKRPTQSPNNDPSVSPTRAPTKNPTIPPTKNPSTSPTLDPSQNPSISPSESPSRNPSLSPTKNPTANPSFQPSTNPSFKPSSTPTLVPSQSPNNNPTSAPSQRPNNNPSTSPTTDDPETTDEPETTNNSKKEVDFESYYIIIIVATTLFVCAIGCCCVFALCFMKKNRQLKNSRKELTSLKHVQTSFSPSSLVQINMNKNTIGSHSPMARHHVQVVKVHSITPPPFVSNGHGHGHNHNLQSLQQLMMDSKQESEIQLEGITKVHDNEKTNTFVSDYDEDDEDIYDTDFVGASSKRTAGNTTGGNTAGDV